MYSVKKRYEISMGFLSEALFKLDNRFQKKFNEIHNCTGALVNQMNG